MNKSPGKPPAPVRNLPTRVEAWYLASLIAWTTKMRRPPWCHELAAWLNKSRTAVYSALRTLEYKGYVTRHGAGNTRCDRRFVAVSR